MHFLITAGPTREFLDPVRFLSNRSTGKMGFAIADAALRRGHTVDLIAGPVSLPSPPGLSSRIDILSARDLLKAVQDRLPACDVLIMCAAVADWRPKDVASTKLKKSEMNGTLELVRNPDILKTILPQKRLDKQLFVGFAAETGDPQMEGTRKLREKGLDLLVANDVSQPDVGFAVDTNRVLFLTSNQPPRPLPLMSKQQVGDEIIAWAEGHSASI